MKSARERAEWFVGYTREHPDEDATWRLIAEFKEHARGQRHLCAEAVSASDEGHGFGFVAASSVADRAHALAMNAPAPGEAQ
jgi:hypothetical protein